MSQNFIVTHTDPRERKDTITRNTKLNRKTYKYFKQCSAKYAHCYDIINIRNQYK